VEAQDKTRPLSPYLVFLILFLFIVVMLLTVFLPEIYPESEIIQLLFGRKRFVLFWLIVGAFLSILGIRKQQKLRR